MRETDRLRAYYKLHNAMNFLLLRSYDTEKHSWTDEADHEAFRTLEGLDEAFRKGEFEGVPLTRTYQRGKKA
jgi:hypothetical protein